MRKLLALFALILLISSASAQIADCQGLSFVSCQLSLGCKWSYSEFVCYQPMNCEVLTKDECDVLPAPVCYWDELVSKCLNVSILQ
ncbi:hypothetical protein TTHERM_00171650 (macronuclear) [Tetrahymena thermophila SB210]|uniref:Transmembrane protein n=1 Tax=Tetrahymena thermophila (strain SB210) TaxID=312017 RepID=Q22TG0_TETTS|nr:hypothetical protein TTHERM_00171650 [Tetrahymena thermophila SB210]EAR88478.1 hypothetical protein TTHERM_00171650 [Tetrahymena thermophila SB210]|eukprot:XP_001008723.1 hypothetical protein TTHERM_00171650 [Tetrahymena thermophila SB210]